MSDSTRKSRSRKPDRPKKPYPEFPLTPHASGAWQKKVRGKIHYFGRWGRVVNGKLERIEGDGWKEALEQYKVQADDLHAGRTPRRRNGDELTVKDLANHFLTAKKNQLDAGELSPRSFAEYKATTDLLVRQFGLTRLVDDLASPDFEALRATMARRLGPVRLGNEVQRVRTVFKYGYEAGLIEKPMRYGPQFVKPSRATMRKHRAKAGAKMFEADELRKLIDAARVPLRAMILLGINCAFGNSDCAQLTLSALDLERGWVNFPRPKTGVPRRCPLWPETVEAIREALATRPKPKKADDAAFVFITKYGQSWSKAENAGPLTQLMGRLLKQLGINGRNRLGSYTLRHTFRTVADEAKDQPAADFIMGREVAHMSSVYRETISDQRLRAVTDHVRNWLFATTPDDTRKPEEVEADQPGESHEPKASGERPRLQLFAG